VSRFCRHNRLTAECPICSKGTVMDEARPRARKPGARATARSAPAATSVRGPYAAAGPYPGGGEVRLERVPGGLRLAEWHAGQIARRAPVLDVADLPTLLADAATKELLHAGPLADGEPAADGAYGTSPGRAGELREELRVERVEGGRVRIARWILRPGAGWRLQDAPVLLPPNRFAEALAAAGELGVLVPDGASPL
jgi:hypothetical protein